MSTPSTERDDRPLLRTSDVADLLRVCTHTVRRMVLRGELTPLRFNCRTIRFKPAEVERYINSALPAGATPFVLPETKQRSA